jgi:hypothetical protein
MSNAFEQLAGFQLEWLLRAATKSPYGAPMPPAVVATLGTAGLGQHDGLGQLQINHAGRQYLAMRHLPTTPARTDLERAPRIRTGHRLTQRGPRVSARTTGHDFRNTGDRHGTTRFKQRQRDRSGIERIAR